VVAVADRRNPTVLIWSVPTLAPGSPAAQLVTTVGEQGKKSPA
jgi:hypothetical protein